jgi:hypothetical protein
MLVVYSAPTLVCKILLFLPDLQSPAPLYELLSSSEGVSLLSEGVCVHSVSFSAVHCQIRNVAILASPRAPLSPPLAPSLSFPLSASHLFSPLCALLPLLMITRFQSED